jgi:uncharacterized phage protein (TIGR01671 family)
MREIKFRAWDRNERDSFRMKNNLSLNSAYFQQETLEGIEVMQFTRLHDKNGKEIYEGDILSNGEIIGDVQWMGWMWNMPNYYEPSQDDPSDAFSEEKKWVVIGNIYENPDLLK